METETVEEGRGRLFDSLEYLTLRKIVADVAFSIPCNRLCYA